MGIVVVGLQRRPTSVAEIAAFLSAKKFHQLAENFSKIINLHEFCHPQMVMQSIVLLTPLTLPRIASVFGAVHAGLQGRKSR